MTVAAKGLQGSLFAKMSVHKQGIVFDTELYKIIKK